MTRLPFDASVRDDLVVAAGDGLGTYLQYLKLVLPMLAILLAFILVMLLLRSLSKRQLALPGVPQPQMLPAAAGVGALPAAAMAAIPPAPDLPAIEAAPDPHEERVIKLAEANPRAVADVVQTWMREGE